VHIPPLDLGKVLHQNSPSAEPPAWDNLNQMIMWISLAWFVLMAVAGGICVAVGLKAPIVIAVVGGMLLFLIGIIVRLYLVKASAMSRHDPEREVLFGLSKMIVWEPTEGVVFLKNKQVHAVDENPHDGGGIRYIFPVLGEQLGLRVPLTIQSTLFTDHNVFTKDYLPVTIRSTIWWKLADLERYYLSISSRDMGDVTDAGSDDWGDESTSRQRSTGQLGMAKSWIAMMAESVGRQELAKTNTAFLVANQISSDLPVDIQKRLPGPEEGGNDVKRTYQSTTEALAHRLETGIRSKVREYGLDVDRVELQEVRLPKEIHAAAVEACSVAFLPAKAEREAAARKIQLETDAEVLGADAVALREVLGDADGMSFLGVPDFLQKLFGKLGQNRRITEQSE
jgi:regulator of protease activity HflC (stomatin/prohibitin superfamily)